MDELEQVSAPFSARLDFFLVAFVIHLLLTVMKISLSAFIHRDERLIYGSTGPKCATSAYCISTYLRLKRRRDSKACKPNNVTSLHDFYSGD